MRHRNKHLWMINHHAFEWKWRLNSTDKIYFKNVKFEMDLIETANKAIKTIKWNVCLCPRLSQCIFIATLKKAPNTKKFNLFYSLQKIKMCSKLPNSEFYTKVNHLNHSYPSLIWCLLPRKKNCENFTLRYNQSIYF